MAGEVEKLPFVFGLTQGSKDAAITVSLPAGGYTVQVSGADGGVGEAIVEIYELPQVEMFARFVTM